jgi:hypothetical protein
MKIYFLIPVIILGSKTNAQTYKTEIGRAYKVEIKKGITNIKKADTVILEIHTDVKSKLFVDNIKEEIDSSGLHTYTIHLTNPYSNTINIDLEVFLDKPAISAECLLGEGTIQSSWKYGVYWSFLGTVRSKSKGGDLIIKANQKIKCTIKGVEGVWTIN